MNILVEVLLIPVIVSVIGSIIGGIITGYIIGKRYILRGTEGKKMKSWKIGIIAALAIFVIGMIFIMGYKEATITKVPDLGNLSQAEVEVVLEEKGLKSQISESFSDLVDKYYVIPDTQDPKAGIYVKKSSVVKAEISLGPFPIVIGKEVTEAEKIIKDAELFPIIMKGYNVSVQKNYVYDQYPKTGKGVSLGSEVTLFVNQEFWINITDPVDEGTVPWRYPVKGKSNLQYHPEIPDLNIEVLVYSYDRWWVQPKAHISLDGNWETRDACWFGRDPNEHPEDIGTSYKICAIIPEEKLREQTYFELPDYSIISEKTIMVTRI